MTNSGGDVDPEWTITHVEEQLYDIASLLRYDATTVKIWGPDVTDAGSFAEAEWLEIYEVFNAGERIRAGLTPRKTGHAAACQLQISWTDESDNHRSEWYRVPIPGREPIPLFQPKEN
jgi:hypothetical protein